MVYCKTSPNLMSAPMVSPTIIDPCSLGSMTLVDIPTTTVRYNKSSVSLSEQWLKHTTTEEKQLSNRDYLDNRSEFCTEKVKFHPEQSTGPWITGSVWPFS